MVNNAANLNGVRSDDARLTLAQPVAIVSQPKDQAVPQSASGSTWWYCELCQVHVWQAGQPKRLRCWLCRKWMVRKG